METERRFMMAVFLGLPGAAFLLASATVQADEAGRSNLSTGDHLSLEVCRQDCGSGIVLLSAAVAREGFCERLALVVGDSRGYTNGTTVLADALLDSGAQRQFALLPKGSLCSNSDPGLQFFDVSVGESTPVQYIRNALAEFSRWRNSSVSNAEGFNFLFADEKQRECVLGNDSLAIVAVSDFSQFEEPSRSLIVFSGCESASGLKTVASVDFLGASATKFVFSYHLGLTL
jgi:hypothetical protein